MIRLLCTEACDIRKLVFALFTGLMCFISVLRVQAADYSQLIGEWSEHGKCTVSRYVFTRDGKYQWVELKDAGGWAIAYEGIFEPGKTIRKNPSDVGAIIIADGSRQGGYLVRFEIISTDRIKGCWDTSESEDLSFENPRDALFDYVRCGKR